MSEDGLTAYEQLEKDLAIIKYTAYRGIASSISNAIFCMSFFWGIVEFMRIIFE